MAISLEKYARGGYPFPKDEINPKDKDEKWGLKWCEAMYARWKQNRTAIPYSAVAEIENLRALADGRQNILQYQKILLDESEENGDMKGYMNINWDVFSVMPKFLRVVEGMMEQTDHQVVASAVDPSSTEEKESAKLDMQYRMKFKETLDYIDKAMGIDRSGEYVPESMEELNLYDGAGGFKLAKEIEIEQGLDYTFYISEWKEIKKKLIRDFCVINAAGTKDYTDQYTKKVKVRYVDPKVFIGQYSKHWDHKNMEYGAEIIQVPISDLRKLNPGIKESVLLELANQYNGTAGNITITTLQFDEENKCGNYDSMLVDVVDAEWMSVNNKYMTTRKTSYGNDMLYEEEWGKVHNTEKKKTEKFDIKIVYKCKWIIGTDNVYDFGLQYDVPRPGKKEVELSYHLYKLPYRSLVSLSESHLHQMCLAFFKLQNAIAMASPPGIAIEFTALQNMTLGGNKLQPLEILKIKRQTGDLLYKATTHKGVPNSPGAWKPIQELQGGIGAQLQEFLGIFEFNTNAIRELTGINQIADASNPNPEMSVGGSEIAMAAANNALRPIYSAYLKIKELTAKNISLRLQLLIANDKEAYKGYMPVIGSVGVQVISVGTDAVDADYFIKYEAKPTEKRKEVIRQAAISAMSPDRDGIIGIELPDFLMIERLLEGGSLKYAEAFLNYKSKKNKERQQNLQRENMNLDKQREQEAIKLKDQLNRSLEQAKKESEIELYAAKKEIDEKYAKLEHEREMELVGLQSSLGIVEKGAESQLANAQQ
jgi:glycerol-3-phosphate cytidylyltransferase-like family protein